ncbi:MAG: DUF979 domain-containing protein [Sporomusaceae bacterium]|nr:DUF979 domain-containing protein [Sporomusaceae bacterium]
MTLQHIYSITGIFLLIFTVLTLRDGSHKRKWGTAVFWLLYGISFIWGETLPPAATGLLVLIMAVIAGCKLTGSGSYNETSPDHRRQLASQYGNRLFGPALLVPVVTLLIAQYTKLGALIGFGIGALTAYACALLLTREKATQSFNEGRRLLDAIGWAVILSQFLAALGFLFDKAGVGKVIAGLVSAVVPADSLLGSVAAYCVGMALFTMIMGNGFAAFAVMTSGIGLPLVVKLHGGDPAVVGVIGMLSGYCGTLLTPMAANFNVVPAALLEMRDKNGVIKAQAATAVPLLLINIMLMYTLAF